MATKEKREKKTQSRHPEKKWAFAGGADVAVTKAGTRYARTVDETSINRRTQCLSARGQQRALRYPVVHIFIAMNDVTRILSAIEAGNSSAADQLLPLVYEELRKLAALQLAQEKPGQTLQATALVHEAYLRLVDTEKAQHWKSRGHFFAAAAEAMRRILVEQARRRHAAKRGGQLCRDELHESSIAAPSDFEETLAINDILDHFSTIDPVAANLVKLRCFVGLTMEEIAQALDISVRSAYDTWDYARTWLHRHLRAE